MASNGGSLDTSDDLISAVIMKSGISRQDRLGKIRSVLDQRENYFYS